MRIGIVGAGPAGVSAALLLSRYEFNITVFEKESIGGLITNAWRIENFPVFYPITGEKMAEILRDRLTSSPVKVLFLEVTEVLGTTVKTSEGIYDFNKLIIASGTVPVRLPEFEVDKNVVYEYRFIPKGIRSLAVYGAGDVAFDSALKAKENGVSIVQIFNRGKTIKAAPKLVDYASRSGIIYHGEEPILGVEPGLRIFTSKSYYQVDALLICIGRKPNLSFVKKGSEDQLIVGDARGTFRQMSIAIGNAVETAMKIVSEVHRL